MLIDVLQHRKRQRNRQVYAVLYDQKKAYDSVQHYTIERTLERFGMPEEFINFVMTSLQEATSSVTTQWGTTRPFQLLTSVKQGDPLSPIIYAMITDALHEGYEKLNAGYKMNEKGLTISSIGYADDTIIVSDTEQGIRRLHQWTMEFFQAHHFSLNTQKTLFVSSDSAAGNLCSTSQSEVIKVQSSGTSFRYLGLILNIDLKWDKQEESMTKQIRAAVRRIVAYQLDFLATITTIREMLLPKLELGLKFAKITTRRMESWDHLIRGCLIGTMNASKSTKWSLATTAVEMVTEIPKISKLRTIIRTTELMQRANGSHLADPSAETFWADIGITIDDCTQLKADMLHRLIRPGEPDAENERETEEQEIKERKSSSTGSSWTKDTINMMEKAGARIAANNNEVKNCRVVEGGIIEDDRSNDEPEWLSPRFLTQKVQSISIQTGAIDRNKEWVAYTDGSTCPGTKQNSGYGVVLTRRSEKSTDTDRDGSVCRKFYGTFKSSGNNFLAELAGIAVALRIIPIDAHVIIKTDSLAAVLALKKQHRSERKRLRTAARPMIRMIQEMIDKRRDNTGQTSLQWIKAHTNGSSTEAVWNDVADRLANEGRVEGQRYDSIPDFTYFDEPILMYQNGTHVIGDYRKECKRAIDRQTFREWRELKHQGAMISDSKISSAQLVEVVRLIKTWRSAITLSIFLQSVTRWWPTEERLVKMKKVEKKDEKKCVVCETEKETMEHLLECQGLRVLTQKTADEMNRTLGAEQVTSARIAARETRLSQSEMDRLRKESTPQWFDNLKGQKVKAVLEIWGETNEEKEMITRICRYPKVMGAIGMTDKDMVGLIGLIVDEENKENPLSGKQRRQTIMSRKNQVVKAILTHLVNVYQTWRRLKEKANRERKDLKKPKQRSKANKMVKEIQVSKNETIKITSRRPVFRKLARLPRKIKKTRKSRF
jgi:hypothetical protein